MTLLLSLVLAFGPVPATPVPPGTLDGGALTPAARAPTHVMDDGGSVLRTGATQQRLRRVRRGARKLRVPLPRRPARRTAYQDDLAQDVALGDATTRRLRERDRVARLVALDILRSHLSPRLSRRTTPPRTA